MAANILFLQRLLMYNNSVLLPHFHNLYALGAGLGQSKLKLNFCYVGNYHFEIYTHSLLE